MVIAEKIANKSSSPSGGFHALIDYVARDDRRAAEIGHGPLAGAAMGVVNMDADVDTAEDRKIVAEIMNATAMMSCRVKNPIYHLVVSWQSGEHPDRRQAEEAVHHVMKSIGMEECECFWAMHRDTDNDHLHLAINRVHPVKGVAIKTSMDYYSLDQAMRELELLQGWGHAPGPKVVIRDEKGKATIVSLSKKGRRDLGLLREERAQWQREPTDQAAKRAHHQGAPSFQEWVTHDPARALREVLALPGATWETVHQQLAEYGLAILPKNRGQKSGLVVTSQIGDRVISAKASQLGRWAARQALEQKLGPWRPLVGDVTRLPVKDSYGEFLDRFQKGMEDGWGTGRKEHRENVRRPDDEHGRHDRQAEDPGYEEKRRQRREERARARDELHQRFKVEQLALKEKRKKQRREMTERHGREREALRRDLSGQRVDFIADGRSKGVSPKISASLWAFQAAQEREALQIQQAQERKGQEMLPRSLVWREWLEQQAGRGDEAAKAALRGIRYQEQRDAKRKQNGIEGEDLEPLRPVLMGIKADVDHHRQVVTYRAADGEALFTDTGSRIDVHNRDAVTMEAALRVAAQKYGGQVELTGTAAFREEAARIAARLGIGVLDEDLKEVWGQERAVMEQERTQRGGGCDQDGEPSRHQEGGQSPETGPEAKSSQSNRGEEDHAVGGGVEPQAEEHEVEEGMER
jgi:hypothetical protein